MVKLDKMVRVSDGELMFRYPAAANRTANVATPEAYRETGRFEIPDKGAPSWAYPVISDGRLYVRNQDTLLVYDIRASS